MKHPESAPVPNESPDAQDLRAAIARANLSQRGAARELGVDDRTMRYWCAGEQPAPRMALLALDPVARYREHLRQSIALNDRQIEMLESGQLAVRRGPGPADPAESAAEAVRLRRTNRELRSILRMDEAFHRRQEALAAVAQQFYPNGNGAPTEDSMERLDAASVEFEDAKREADNLVRETR